MHRRVEFDSYRFEANRVIPWDWADLSEAEKRDWITRAKRPDSPEPSGT